MSQFLDMLCSYNKHLILLFWWEDELLVKRLLYTQFKGNRFTRLHITQEKYAAAEYRKYPEDRGHTVVIEESGLCVSDKNNYLAASTDRVINVLGNKICWISKMPLSNNQTMSMDAIKETKQYPNFTICLKHGSVCLNQNRHLYYQVQGQMNIYDVDWCDVRRR